MFLLKAFEDRIAVPVSADAFAPQPLITDAALATVTTPSIVVPNVQSFELTAQIASPVGIGVQFADQHPVEVTISASFPIPTDLGLAFGAAQPFSLFGTAATFDGFTFF